MKSYRVVWAGAWAVALVPLTLVGLVLGEPPVVLILSGLAMALVAAIAEHRHHRRWWLEAGIAVGAFSAVVYTVGPAAALGLLLLVGVTSPLALRAFARAVHRERRTRSGAVLAEQRATLEEVRAGAPLGSEAFEGMVQLLDDHELIAAWRQSHEVLGYTNLPDLRLQLIALRQSYLDEMERRHPRGFAAWMKEGALPDPERFLTPGRTRELE
jgi:membrane protein implicated in regulation of membrane protease activity